LAGRDARRTPLASAVQLPPIVFSPPFSLLILSHHCLSSARGGLFKDGDDGAYADAIIDGAFLKTLHIVMARKVQIVFSSESDCARAINKGQDEIFLEAKWFAAVHLLADHWATVRRGAV
jgi:hypothetical protein